MAIKLVPGGHPYHALAEAAANAARLITPQDVESIIASIAPSCGKPACAKADICCATNFVEEDRAKLRSH
jgi:hypothetical protein